MFCSRPLGITSISRTTMSARLAPPFMRAESVSLNFPMRLASRVNCEPPTRPESTATDFSGRHRRPARTSRPACRLQADVSVRAGVVVDGHRNRDAVALGERDWQIEIHEEILKDLQARSGAAQRAVRGGSHHRHAPGVMESAMGIGNAGAAVLIGDDFRIDVERLGEVGAHVRSGRSRTSFGESRTVDADRLRQAIGESRGLAIAGTGANCARSANCGRRQARPGRSTAASTLSSTMSPRRLASD